MEQQQQQQQYTRPSQQQSVIVAIDQLSEAELELYDIYTPDDEYFTPPTAGAVVTTTTTTPTAGTEDEPTVFSQNEYQSSTIKAHNKARETILPLFPPRSSLISMSQKSSRPMTTTTTTDSNETIDFLLCNIPKRYLTFEQYERRQMNKYIKPFQIRSWDEIRRTKYNSYMLKFYSNIYDKSSKRWHIDIPILDYNLGRLHELEIKYNFQFSFHDLPIALEFYLQVDIDVFHLKTCSFRQAQPRIITDSTNGKQLYEGIFTNDQQSVDGRYDMKRCNKTSCLCCRRRSFNVQFTSKQIHTFLNQYKAILNCPVTCTTSNIIYALTCPCGQKDYVAHTNLSFVDCLHYHRREIVRTIYEFLIGETNADLIELKPKTEEAKANDSNCKMPYRRSSTLSPSAQIETTVTNVPTIRRSDTLSMRLANNVPKPTDPRYTFTLELFNEQKSYFKYGRDRAVVNIHNMYFYNASIVAVLPDQCSDAVKKFIESLFITHGECQLNKDGRLIQQQISNDYPTRGHWYRGLIRRPTSSIVP